MTHREKLLLVLLIITATSHADGQVANLLRVLALAFLGVGFANVDSVSRKDAP